MPVLKWTQDLEIGIKSIDDQHRQLINIINELHLAVEQNKGNETIIHMIDKLHQYADSHFRDEEAILEKHEYPDLEDHVLEHEEFIAKLDELKSKYLSSKEALTIHLRNYILAWFYHHIKINDMEYRRFLEQKNLLLLYAPDKAQQ